MVDKIFFGTFIIGSILFILGVAILNAYVLAIGGIIQLTSPMIYMGLEEYVNKTKRK
jgi:hypothetical protein